MELDARTLHVVCPACHATNRVLEPRLVDGRCGRCTAPLFQGTPAELTAAEFERHLAHSDIPLLVDFWAPWCGPCRAMAPEFAAAARALEPECRLVKINTDRAPDIAARHRIQGIPTLALFRHGREVARVAGVLTAPRLVAWVRANT